MSYVVRSTDSTSMRQAICLTAHHHTIALCLHTSHCRIPLFMGSVHCLVLWKQHNGPETESVPFLWGKSGEATSSVASGRNTWYPFPKLCVVFITLGLSQSPEMQQNSAVRALQNWRVYLYKFT
jgi:hypothetical protein